TATAVTSGSVAAGASAAAARSFPASLTWPGRSNWSICPFLITGSSASMKLRTARWQGRRHLALRWTRPAPRSRCSKGQAHNHPRSITELLRLGSSTGGMGLMNDVTRRQAVGVASLAGAFAVAGLNPGTATADDKPKSEFDEKADRQRVIACGFTEA